MKFIKYLLLLLSFSFFISSCKTAGSDVQETEKNVKENMKSETLSLIKTETALDGQIDFDGLKEINPDIFAWIYIPGTNIDYPVLQSPVADDYYKSHDENGEQSEQGALYTEMPNNMNMCDFNTIIHGFDKVKEDLFYELHLFEEQDFFMENELLYIYLPDNVLTYEIVAAYYDDGSDILRRYDYTTHDGCQHFLEDMYQGKSMTKHIRNGWEGLNEYHFLITLDGIVRENNTQYVVIGALIEDSAGTINRIIYEE